MINKFYKGIISLFFLTDFFIIYGIVLSVAFNKIKIMMSLTIVGRAVPIIWGVLFIIFLLGLIFYRHKIISFKEFIASIFVITLTCYLTYLCQFTHTPDIFTCDDLIWSTERIFLYFPKEYYWVILQGISYIISIIVKDKKNLKGLKINIVISFIRIFLLFICISILFIQFCKDCILEKNFLFILIFFIYFIISCIIEFGIDFVIKKCSKVNLV